MIFGDRNVKPSVRRLSEMSEVVYDRVWLSAAQDMELYFMYRDLSLSDSDKTVITENRLRYDITVIPPNKLGLEYVKTAGHYHPNVPETTVSYPELYQVLEGRAHYLMQNLEGARVTDVFVVEADAGDCVLIPPGYGHVTINPSEKELKMANWVCRDFASDYGFFKEKHGAAYFELSSGMFKANKSYGKTPKLRHMKPTRKKEVGLPRGGSMYQLVKNPRALDYLIRPQNHVELFRRVLEDED